MRTFGWNVWTAAAVLQRHFREHAIQEAGAHCAYCAYCKTYYSCVVGSCEPQCASLIGKEGSLGDLMMCQFKGVAFLKLT